MSNKKRDMLNGGIGSLIPTTLQPEPNQHQEPAATNEHEEKRSTYITRVDLADKIRAIAYWERSEISEKVNEAFDMYIKAYEEKNGPIKLPPKKK